MRWKRPILRCIAAALATGFCLAGLELALRLHHAIDPARPASRERDPHATGADGQPPIPLHRVLDSPVLYGLNPAHPDVNALGLRDDETTLARPPGVYRILVLGDSIAYGQGVLRHETFPKRLQSLLRKQRPRIEVLNAGVSGYSPYNELQLYLTQGREFQPDLVVVAFCMNDVANPRLHWNYTREDLSDIPAAAIPNLRYDRDHAQPALRARRQPRPPPSFPQSWLLYQALDGRICRLMEKRPPTYITDEDTLDIEVLMQDTTPEWIWLTSTYSTLRQAVEQDGARLAIVLFPLAYQLDADYPFLPQVRIAAFCQRQGIPCLDLLPVFRTQPAAKVFQLDSAGYHDIWHLTRAGHRLTAEALAGFLAGHRLLDRP